jgi:uncharacterized protein (TIGR02186 family)
MEIGAGRRRLFAVVAGLFIVGAFLGGVEAQTQKQRPPQPPPPAARPLTPPDSRGIEKRAPNTVESVQADVSTRTVAVTSSFTGTEIVVFGAVENSQQPSSESNYYDIVIVVEGAPSRVTARRKTNAYGVWINTQSIRFEGVPSYYAVASNRPLDEIGTPELLKEHDLGLENMRLSVGSTRAGFTAQDLAEFRNSVIRLKRASGLYVQAESDVTFIGRSLFRSRIKLPANVNVGPFNTHVYLFREDKLLSQYTRRFELQREGLERFLYDFALNRPLLYGIATVVIALGAGLAASTVFRRGSH